MSLLLRALDEELLLPGHEPAGGGPWLRGGRIVAARGGLLLVAARAPPLLVGLIALVAHVDSLAPLPPLPGLIRRLGPRGLGCGGWFERHLLHDGRRALLGLPPRGGFVGTRPGWLGQRVALEAPDGRSNRGRGLALRRLPLRPELCRALQRLFALLRPVSGGVGCLRGGGSRGVNGRVRGGEKQSRHMRVASGEGDETSWSGPRWSGRAGA